MNDMKAIVYKVTEWILNICINYANEVTGAHKPQQSCFSREALVLSIDIV